MNKSRRFRVSVEIGWVTREDDRDTYQSIWVAYPLTSDLSKEYRRLQSRSRYAPASTATSLSVRPDGEGKGVRVGLNK